MMSVDSEDKRLCNIWDIDIVFLSSAVTEEYYIQVVYCIELQSCARAECKEWSAHHRDTEVADCNE